MTQPTNTLAETMARAQRKPATQAPCGPPQITRAQLAESLAEFVLRHLISHSGYCYHEVITSCRFHEYRIQRVEGSTIDFELTMDGEPVYTGPLVNLAKRALTAALLKRPTSPTPF